MRIVLNLSTSYVWNRPPVGIVRTEQRFAQYLLAQEDVPVAFCRFDKERKAHVPLARSEAARLVHFDAPALLAADAMRSSGRGSSPTFSARPMGSDSFWSATGSARSSRSSYFQSAPYRRLWWSIARSIS